MSQKSTVTEHMLNASSIHLADVLEYIDMLHSAASEGQSRPFAEMDDTETMSVLRDLIYTAQETIIEIESNLAKERKMRRKQPVLRIVEKIEKAG